MVFKEGVFYGKAEEIRAIKIKNQEELDKIQSNDGATENTPLGSMASTGHDINEISDEESVTELEDTLPREITLKLT
ncbi:hypothetical protein [Candidatus Rickettsia colombianensi]|uniref:hypothetical protein n=1 Tax=Candidatus Rickettsia colombianensi TaxID=1090944 RepID=UPI000EF29520|nr:hypothetical protein [Candidatus Rickettsia colombianensi]